MKQIDELIIETEHGLLIESEKFIELFNFDTTNEQYAFLSKVNRISHIEILELAARLSYLKPNDLDRNLSFIDFAEIMIGNKEKHFLISSFRMLVMKNFLDSRPNEYDIHDLFKNNYKKVLSDQLEIVKRKNNPKHIPDFWLKKKDEYIPVEIKLNGFNGTHLKQLERYMNFYDCSNGIAVAKELRCPLPNNIKFINYEKLQEA